MIFYFEHFLRRILIMFTTEKYEIRVRRSLEIHFDAIVDSYL